MKLVTTKFKSGGLYEKHEVAAWNVGNHLSICLQTQWNQEKPVSRWPVAGPSEYWLLASSPASKEKLYFFCLFIFLSFLFFVRTAWVTFLAVIWFLMALFFLVCEFAFLWFWPESPCSVWVIFLGVLIFEVKMCFVRPLNHTAVLYSMFEYDWLPQPNTMRTRRSFHW